MNKKRTKPTVQIWYISNMPKTLNKVKFVQAKAQGHNNTESALIAGSKNRISAQRSGHNLAYSTDVQIMLANELKRLDITLANSLMPIKLGLEADMVNEHTGEILPDFNTRLKASDRALKLLGVYDQKRTKNEHEQQPINKELISALKDGDEIELQRIVFNKQSD